MSSGDITQLLTRWRDGDEEALRELTPLVYNELHRLAHRYVRHSGAQTLQSTALVHEAYLRLVHSDRVDWQNRAHFFAVAATLIRNVLVDRARARNAAKRGGGATVLSLDESLGAGARHDLNVVAVDDLLLTLSRVDPRQSRIIELRFFAGLSIEESAEVIEAKNALHYAQQRWKANDGSHPRRC